MLFLTNRTVSHTICCVLYMEDMRHQAVSWDKGNLTKSVMLLNKFYWESLGPAINIDVTLTRSTNLSIIADHKHSFMDIIFPDVFSSSRITHHIAKQNSQEMD